MPTERSIRVWVPANTGVIDRDHLLFRLDRAAKGVVGMCLFQTGPIKEAGRNGLQVEDLLEAARERLMTLQSPSFQDANTQSAIIHLEHALALLDARTRLREIRGVEGTSTP